MSTIIELIITFVLYFLVALAAALPLAIFHTRKMDKLISNYFRTIDESCAALDKSLDESHTARSQSQDEASAQVDEIHESLDKIHKDIGEMSESLDRMGEFMDKLIESTRVIRDYSNLKIKMIEARENFREPEFWDEKNIH